MWARAHQFADARLGICCSCPPSVSGPGALKCGRGLTFGARKRDHSLLTFRKAIQQVWQQAAYYGDTHKTRMLMWSDL